MEVLTYKFFTPINFKYVLRDLLKLDSFHEKKPVGLAH